MNDFLGRNRKRAGVWGIVATALAFAFALTGCDLTGPYPETGSLALQLRLQEDGEIDDDMRVVAWVVPAAWIEYQAEVGWEYGGEMDLAEVAEVWAVETRFPAEDVESTLAGMRAAIAEAAITETVLLDGEGSLGVEILPGRYHVVIWLFAVDPDGNPMMMFGGSYAAPEIFQDVGDPEPEHLLPPVNVGSGPAAQVQVPVWSLGTSR